MLLLSLWANQFLFVPKSVLGNDVENSKATRPLRCVEEFLGNCESVCVRIQVCSE